MAKAWLTTLPLGCQLEWLTKLTCGGVSSPTLFALVILVELEALESSTTGYELMGELGFIVWVVIPSTLVVDLFVSILRVT